MLIVAEQVFLLFVFILAGFLLSKTKLVHADHTKILSALEVYVFLPCVSFNSFAENCTLEYLANKYPLILVSSGLLLLLWFGGNLLAKRFSKENYERTLYAYTFTIPNYGYMGIALCQSLFGELALLDLMVFTLPLSVFVSSAGFHMLTRQNGKWFSWKRIFTPSMIGILLGAAVSLSGLQLPAVISDISNRAADCMAPVSMLLTGIVISQFRIGQLLKDERSYLVSVIRLIGIPLVIYGVLKLFRLDSMIPTAILVYAMPCGMNTIVYPRFIGENCRIGASLVLISTVLAMVTVPLCVHFLT